MTKRHLLICGERGVGKSTLIRRLLEENRRPLAGFVTKRLRVADEEGFYPIYIYPAGQPEEERRSVEETLVGTCDSRRSRPRPEVFDTLGTAYLAAPEGSLIVMDELGFLENGAAAFQQAVLRALDGDTPVLAAVKPRDSAFLERVRSHPKAELVRIDPENREALYEVCLPWIRRMNGD